MVRLSDQLLVLSKEYTATIVRNKTDPICQLNYDLVSFI